MFGNVLGITRWLAFGPGVRIKIRSFSEWRYRQSRPMPGWPCILYRAGARTRLENAAATTRCFLSYLPRPNATLFVVTRPLVHAAMSILVPDWCIFIVKACCAFSYGRERACRFKSNIPRKIKSDGLLCKTLAY